MVRIIIAAAVCSFAVITTAQAQSWPARPINLVVPFAAGGPVDTIARIMGARMSEILGQQIMIENIGGAGGMTGSARVAQGRGRTAIRCCCRAAPCSRSTRRSTASRSTTGSPTSSTR